MNVKKYLLFLVILCISMPIFADKGSKVLETKVNFFKPGAPTMTKTGFCWIDSIAVSRDGAWRCKVDNVIYDPCFSTNFTDKVVCGADPTTNNPGFYLKLSQPLPKPFKVESAQARAWLIKLEDDQICSPYTGTMPAVRYNNDVIGLEYGCPNGINGESNGLIEDSVIVGKVWRAKKATYVLSPDPKDPSLPDQKVVKIQSVKIKEVWI